MVTAKTFHCACHYKASLRTLEKIHSLLRWIQNVDKNMKNFMTKTKTNMTLLQAQTHRLTWELVDVSQPCGTLKKLIKPHDSLHRKLIQKAERTWRISNTNLIPHCHMLSRICHTVNWDFERNGLSRACKVITCSQYFHLRPIQFQIILLLLLGKNMYKLMPLVDLSLIREIEQKLLITILYKF